MPVHEESSKVLLNGDGVQTDFSFSFKIFKAENVNVYLVKADGVEEPKTLGVDYTFSSDDVELGGTITMTVAPLATEKVLIIRSIPLIQDADFRPVSGFPEEVITDTFDQSRMIDQDLQEQLDRCVKVTASSSTDPDALVQQVERIYDSVDNVDTVANNISDVTNVSDNINDINTVSRNIADVVAVGQDIANVIAVADNETNINIVADDLNGVNDIGTVAMGIDDVHAVGQNIGDVMAVADNEADISEVAGISAAITTCANNIQDIQDASDNAELSRLWSKGPENDLQTKTQDPTAHSSKYYSEQSAQAQIQSDCAQTDTTMKSYINNKDLQYFSNETTKFANQDLSDLSATGQGILDSKLNQNQISNCILQDPQNIKLELDNGTLTLKAGSVVCVPNGFEDDGTTPKFDEVTIESDVSYATTSSDGKLRHLCYDTVSNNLFLVENTQSGTAGYSGSGNCFYYFTNTNILRRYSSGVLNNNAMSFPIAIIKSASTSALDDASIDRTFQSIGYIGSTVFVRKGLKGLIPDGRNEDGTLKNIEFTTDKVLTYTSDSRSYDEWICLSLYSTGLKVEYAKFSDFSYYPQDNLIKRNSDGALRTRCHIGTCTTTNSVISNFQPKTTFHAIDYSDLNLEANQAPYIKTTYTSSTSGYNIWSNGYCEQWGRFSYGSGSDNRNVTVNLTKTFKDTNYNVEGIEFGTTGATSAGNYVNSNRVYSVATSSFVIRVGQSQASSFMWKASGYLASGQY